MEGLFRTYADPAVSLQTRADAAVVIATIMRPSLQQALHSVFAQDFAGRIQILVGVDVPGAGFDLIDSICAARPANCTLHLFYPGYSTAQGHGGLTQSQAGGALRCVLSLLANSPRVAYLDDDNWWRPDHLRRMRHALDHADWAYCLRWFVHPETRRPICVDQWESVGPGKGVFAGRFGGFVDTNCLMLNKLACETVLPLWNRALPEDPAAMSSDRRVFEALSRGFRGAGVPHPTVYYALNPQDSMHETRMSAFGADYERAGRTE